MDDDEFYRILSIVRLSAYKQTILKHFHEHGGAMTPTDIGEETEIHRNHVSRHLRELQDEGIMTVINPDAPRYRYYRLSSKGQEFVKRMVECGYLSR